MTNFGQWVVGGNYTRHFLAGEPSCQYKTLQGFLSLLQWTVSIGNMVWSNSKELIFTLAAPDM